MKSKTSPRYIFVFLTLFIFIIEILIALFVRDAFLRPYVGDMLVTVLICSFIRIFFPQKIKYLPIFVFLFALAVEIGQYFDFVTLLGLSNIRFFKILLGATFSIADIFCYLFGCITFYALEKFLLKKLKTKNNYDKN
ncbi:MAG: DUF2809 domain-containing protein [Clostridia bacterium]|nr:DUF2809 domain-containing protein [Clostridia bacterium]